MYVFDLNGRIIEDKIVRNLRRPNNVDVEYGLVLNGVPVDIAVVTERLMHRIRIFLLPDMTAVDNGGIEVFLGERPGELREPMGVALYKRPGDGAVYALVGRKGGPNTGYLWQYRLLDDGTGRVRAMLVRKFGEFCGKGEIEAIAVDDALEYVYYSDAQAGIRKYHADPDNVDEEIALFGTACLWPYQRIRRFTIIDGKISRETLSSKITKPVLVFVCTLYLWLNLQIVIFSNQRGAI